jgi:flagellar motor protein MotB
MKSKIMFIALYSVAFMFPSIGSVDTAVADPGAHTSMGAPAPFDDGLMGAPTMSGAAITGSDSKVPGTKTSGSYADEESKAGEHQNARDKQAIEQSERAKAAKEAEIKHARERRR